MSAPEQALPATGDAARIAELERQLAEARAELERAWITHGDLRESSEHLKDQLAASEKDRERLDWLEKNRRFIMRITDGGNGWSVDLSGGRSFYGPTLRAAIDAAMKEAR